MNYENDAAMDTTLGNMDELWSALTRDSAELQKTYQQFLSESYLLENKDVLQAGMQNPALNKVLALSTEGFKTGIKALVDKIIEIALRIFGYLKSALGIYAWKGREIRQSGQKLLEHVAGVQDNPKAGKIDSQASVSNLHINGRFPSNLSREFDAVIEKWDQVMNGLDSSKFIKLVNDLADAKDPTTAVGDVRTEINKLFQSLTPIADTDPTHIGLAAALPGQDFRISRVLPGQRFLYAYLAETNALVGKFKAGVQKDNHMAVNGTAPDALKIKDIEHIANALMRLGSEISKVADSVAELEKLERYVKRLAPTDETKPQEISSVVAFPIAFQALYNGFGSAVVTICRAVTVVCKLSATEHLKKTS